MDFEIDIAEQRSGRSDRTLEQRKKRRTIDSNSAMPIQRTGAKGGPERTVFVYVARKRVKKRKSSPFPLLFAP